MSRPARPRWHAGNARWCSNIGPPNAKGRATTVYFPAAIGRHDRPARDGIPLRAWEYLEARLAEQPGRAALDDPTDPTASAICQVYLCRYEAEAAAGRVERKHYVARRSHLARLCITPRADGSPWGRAYVRDLGPDDLDAAVDAWCREGLAPHTVRNLHASARAAFAWAARPVAGRVPPALIPRDPTAGSRKPGKPPKADRSAEAGPTRAFFRWAWAEARARPGPARRFDRIFLLMLQALRRTGARPKELATARWDDVRWGRGVLAVPRHKSSHRGRAREIRLAPAVARIFLALAHDPLSHPTHVFAHALGRGRGRAAGGDPTAGRPYADGTAVAARLARLRRRATAAGVPLPLDASGRFTAYGFRHLAISDALMSGIPAEVVAEHYAHFTGDYLDRAALGLARGRKPEGRN